MPMLLIEGNYRVLNSQPDGDSIRFYPLNPDHWQLLPGNHRVEPNQAGGAQARFDGIDSLETHYPTSGGGFGTVNQPLQHGHAAASEALDWLGFTNVVRRADETVTASTPEFVPGYLITRTADRNGRCVAFLFRGAAPVASGSEIFLDVPLLEQSLNFHLLQLGLAYPTYYTKLFPDLRDAMTVAAQTARQNSLALWAEDVTTSGFTFLGPETIFEDVVILPKLFRRLMDYLALNDGSSSLAGFKGYLEARDDRLIILSTGHVTGFDFVVDVNGQQLLLNRPPEDLVFMEA
jgi:hypothetical protein